ncbi:MAG TPA: metal-sensing transcriptional repressor [bacterium]|jgi:DNA-binding FrmR family transcriptional regulator|nr:metal-sensing transcriptional repressor [bacterium]
MKKHQTHPAILKRLQRAHGHLQAVLAMIGAGRECVDIAQQLQAVEKAVKNAKQELIQDHIEHCLEDGPGRGSSLAELRELAKYLA